MIGRVLVLDRSERNYVVDVKMAAGPAAAASVPVAGQNASADGMPVRPALIYLVAILKIWVVSADPMNVATGARAIFAGSLGSRAGRSRKRRATADAGECCNLLRSAPDGLILTRWRAMFAAPVRQARPLDGKWLRTNSASNRDVRTLRAHGADTGAFASSDSMMAHVIPPTHPQANESLNILKRQ